MVRLRGLLILFSLSLVVLGCQNNNDAFDMKLTKLSRSSVGVKNLDARKLEGCVILINGVNGYWHEPERSSFNKGESRSFSLTRFYSSAKRQFDYNVDSVSSVMVNCDKPRGTAVVFETNKTFEGFLR